MFPEVGSLQIQRLELNEATEHESELLFQPASRQSQLAGLNSKWNLGVVAAMERAVTVDPFKPDLPDGTVVPAVEAVDWSGNSDIRPRIWDNSAGQFRLIDSGSMITATQRLPGDKPDNRLRLMAVNGSEIKTYGIRELKIKIGQKEYKMPAVFCDVGQDILGADFINKYKLGMEWDDFDQTELFLSDKNIS